MGRAWSFSSFHRSENGIGSFQAAASLVPRGEWAFRRSKSALPACQACGLDAPHVLAELRSSPNMRVLPRRNVLLCFQAANNLVAHAAIARSAQVKAHLWAIPKGSARVHGRFQRARRALVGDSKWAGRARA